MSSRNTGTAQRADSLGMVAKCNTIQMLPVMSIPEAYGWRSNGFRYIEDITSGDNSIIRYKGSLLTTVYAELKLSHVS